jgi:hypothetical protein
MGQSQYKAGKVMSLRVRSLVGYLLKVQKLVSVIVYQRMMVTD